MMKSTPLSTRRRRLDEVASALGRRFPSATFKGAAPTRSTGVSTLDSLLPGGGLPLGRVSLLSGPTSSGRASLALAVAVDATRDGRPIAWIDTHATFHPPSAAAAGVDLDRVLLVQPPGRDLAEALHAAVVLLRTGALSLLVLDVGLTTRSKTSPRARHITVARDAAARLRRSVCADALCLVLSDESPPPALLGVASLAVALDRRDCLWSGGDPLPITGEGREHQPSSHRVSRQHQSSRHASPRSLGGLTVTAKIVRSRLGDEGRVTELSLRRLDLRSDHLPEP